MLHSVWFLDRSGQVLKSTHVQAPSEIEAFRILAGNWPPGASSVRILPTFGFDDPAPPLSPPATPSPSGGLEAGGA